MEFESHSLSLVGLQESKAAPPAAIHDDGEAAKTLQEQWYLFIISSKIIF